MSDLSTVETIFSRALDEPTPERRAAYLSEACAGDMYEADNDEKKSNDARGRAKDLAGRVQTKYSDSDYAARSAGLVYKMEQQIPIYGSEN